MERKKLGITIINTILISLFTITVIGCTYSTTPRYEIMTSYDGCDSTFFIINALDADIIYEAGWNRIKKDTVIGHNHIYIEDIITEECSSKIIICNDRYKNLYYAANLLWCDKFNEQDWKTWFNEKINKSYRIIGLDINKKQILLKYFNNTIDTLALEEIPPYSTH